MDGKEKRKEKKRKRKEKTLAPTNISPQSSTYCGHYTD
jgi:hypothetical protein